MVRTEDGRRDGVVSNSSPRPRNRPLRRNASPYLAVLPVPSWKLSTYIVLECHKYGPVADAGFDLVRIARCRWFDSVIYGPGCVGWFPTP